ncbi:glucosamine-6-phosphate deaminase [Roseibacillus persicicus]|uniref:Glucosamine-6-phosphate deaminase n=2 Tax=Roseibacillus persicicus TaxID=454148 RepID=A0A918WN24_9BACT|nr:glucosamine-6-phosphate deaminase [Roseibacillus persicicus]
MGVKGERDGPSPHRISKEKPNQNLKNIMSNLSMEQWGEPIGPEVMVHSTSQQAVEQLAGEIAAGIRKRTRQGGRYVLGLATGSTPIPLYEELVRLHREEGLSFEKVTTFNLDEYYGLSPESEQSYHHFMQKHLFSKVDIAPERIHIPDGMVPRNEVERYCAEYEEAITQAGGIDLQILGIGRTGHIGFNEPPSDDSTRTRLVTLDPVTRQDAASDFGGLDFVPKEAITMGIATILEARTAVLLAWGERKQEIVSRSLASSPSSSIPASFLNLHQDAAYLLDEAAAPEFQPA